MRADSCPLLLMEEATPAMCEVNARRGASHARLSCRGGRQLDKGLQEPQEVVQATAATPQIRSVASSRPASSAGAATSQINSARNPRRGVIGRMLHCSAHPPGRAVIRAAAASLSRLAARYLSAKRLPNRDGRSRAKTFRQETQLSIWSA